MISVPFQFRAPGQGLTHLPLFLAFSCPILETPAGKPSFLISGKSPSTLTRAMVFIMAHLIPLAKESVTPGYEFGLWRPLGLVTLDQKLWCQGTETYSGSQSEGAVTSKRTCLWIRESGLWESGNITWPSLTGRRPGAELRSLGTGGLGECHSRPQPLLTVGGGAALGTPTAAFTVSPASRPSTSPHH